MKAGWIVAVCVYLCANRIKAINLNNIDIQEPILRVSPAAGQDVDLFGYSVAAHQIETLDTGLTDPDQILQDALGKTRIIIGAPKGTYPGGLDLADPGLPASNQSGLIFSCPISPGLCEGVTGDPNTFDLPDVSVDDDNGTGDGRLFDHRPAAQTPPRPGLTPREFENKTGQLLGALVLSTGENVLVCAPRWSELVTLGPLPLGRCYITDRNLTNVRSLQPCSSMGGRPIEAVGQAYCTAGAGAVITDDLIAIGAPGFDLLKGVLWYYEYNSGSLGTGLNLGQSPVLGNVLVPDSTGTLVEVNDIYTGYRVTSGYISNPREAGNRADIVVSVPRYNQTAGRYGRISVYQVPSPPVTGTDVLLMAAAEGEQIGEFFGYSVITADLNNDGYDDVLVGAPMYTDIPQGKVESGRVYIFGNEEGNLNSTPTIILEGDVDRGRFGSSLTNLGDVDNDGYEDFAVGAPYTPSGTGSGAVFIYYGRGDIARIAEQEPFRITAEDMMTRVDGLTNLRTFGWSLSGAVDVDANEYNDLVIGAYDSQAVFVLRSIPVADVYVELNASTSRLNLEGGTVCTYNGIDYPCFTLTIQGNYTGRGLDGSLTVNYTLTEVVTNEQRLFFNLPDMPNTFSDNITFSDTGVAAQDMIINVLVFRINDISSLATLALDFRVEQIYRADSMGDGNQTITSLREFPRVRQLGDTRLQVSLLTNCGDVCDADLDLTNVAFVFRNRTLTGTVSSFVAGTVGSVDFTISYQNNAGQDALNNMLEFDIPEIFDLSVNSAATCTTTGRRAVCQLEDRLTQADGLRSVVIGLTVIQAAVVGTVSVEINFILDTVSRDNITANNMRLVTIPITAEADIFVGAALSPMTIRYVQGLQFPDNAPTTLEDLGSRDAVLSVNVGNMGPSIIPNAQLTIFFPAVFGVTDYLYPFQLDNITLQGAEAICETSGIDPSGLVPSAAATSGGNRRRSLTSPGTKRRRREAIASLVRKPRQTGGTATELNCAENMDACSRITCNITSLATTSLGTGDVLIMITGRVNERFFTNQDSTYSLVAYANVSIIDSFLLPEQGSRPNSARAELMLLPPLADSGEDDSNLIHSIIWPILGGVLLFVLLVLLLYFCGFFRRKKKPEDQQAEGDFDANKFNVQPVDEKKNEEATTL